MDEGLAVGQKKLFSGQFEVILVVSKCKPGKRFSLLRRKLHRRHVFGKNRKNPSIKIIVDSIFRKHFLNFININFRNCKLFDGLLDRTDGKV